MPNFIDVHSHLNFPEYDADRDSVIARMKEKGVWTITVGTDLESSKSAVELAAKHKGIFACVGIHPTDDSEVFNDPTKAAKAAAIFEELAKLARDPKVVAIGECGLDYFRLTGAAREAGLTEESIAAAKNKQKEIFAVQINLATQTGKPLMIHCRDAYDDVYEILAAAKRSAEAGSKTGDTAAAKFRGNVHFFAGDVATAKKFLNIGFTLSFGGVLTFTEQYHEVLRFVPLASIMSETDAPYVSPAPYRGRRNEPAYVEEVVKAIAEIKGLDFEEVRATLVVNAVKFFALDTNNDYML